MRVVLLIVCLLACVTDAAASSNWQLQSGGEMYEVSELGVGSEGDNYFGVYKSAYALTGGTALHLFPNASFAIVDFLDIAPDEVAARGTYKIEGTSLRLDFSYVRPRHQSVQSQFANLHIVGGWIDKGSYVTGFDVFILSSNEWRKFEAGDSEIDCMRRSIAYYDWQKILRKYESN